MSMFHEQVNRDYQVLVDEAEKKRPKDWQPNPDDRRRAHRFGLAHGRAQIRISPTYDVLDVSSCGMAFQSDREFKAGGMLNLAMEDSLDIPAKVVACRMVETDSDLMEYTYLISVEFENPYLGKKAVVMLSEMDRIRQSLGAP